MAESKLKGEKGGADSSSSKKGKRIIQPIEFSQAQWDAIVKSADVEGLKGGPWIRAQALKEARRLGYWNPDKIVKPTGDDENNP